MPTTKRPDVTVQEVLTRPSVGSGLSADAIPAMVGVPNRGAITPTLVNSWSDYNRLFGGFEATTDLPFAVFQYFLNGGGPLLISRVYGSGAAQATRTFNDTAGTPLPTLTIKAKNPGTWGNSLYITVITGTAAGTFDLVVKYGGTGAGNEVERFQNLSIDPASSRYAPAYVASYSDYITATDLNSATALASRAPAAQTDQVLATGTDGSAITNSDWTAAHTRFELTSQPLVIALPGQVTTAVLASVVTAAAATGKNFIVADVPAYTNVAAYATFTAAVGVSDYVAYYGPWVKVQDPSKTNSVTLKTIPASGSVLGRFSSADQTSGVFQTPGGVNFGRLGGVVDVEVTFNNTDLDTLNSGTSPVNVIRPLPNRGICIMGGRTGDTSQATRYVANRRSLNYIKKGLVDLLQFAILAPNDDDLWDSVTTQAQAFLSAFRASGGLAGPDDASAFYVTCDSSNNTALTQANGQVVVDVGVALESPAEFINIRIGLFEGGADAQATES